MSSSNWQGAGFPCQAALPTKATVSDLLPIPHHAHTYDDGWGWVEQGHFVGFVGKPVVGGALSFAGRSHSSKVNSEGGMPTAGSNKTLWGQKLAQNSHRSCDWHRASPYPPPISLPPPPPPPFPLRISPSPLFLSVRTLGGGGNEGENKKMEGKTL